MPSDVAHTTSNAGSGAASTDRVALVDDLGLAPLTGFRFDIQVLRGIAVLLVVLYHAQVVTPGGFVGVDVFFVISGYVIGRRLVARFATPDTPVMGEFYLHRARRILPALSVLLVTVILAAPLLAPIGGVRQTSRTGVAAALFSANLYLYKYAGGGYFQAAAELNPLLHTWSLSVEEQFYFVIPALLLATWLLGRRRFGSVRSARVVVGALIVVSFVLCVLLSRASGTVWHLDGLRFAFFSPFTRAWEFAAGLALVLLPASWLPVRRLCPLLLAVGAALLAYAAFAFSDSTVFPGAAALVPVTGAVLVIHAGTRRTTTRRHAHPGLAPLGFLGDVSYSWYLWHWPLIVFAAAFWPRAGRVPLVVAAAVSLLPAWWSYRWIERRLRATPTSRGRPTVALALVCIAAPLVAAVVAVPLRSLVDQRARTEFRAVSDVAANQPGEEPCNSSTPYGSRSAVSCTWGDGRAASSVVLIGDSNAAHFSNALIGAARSDDARLEIAVFGGCPFVDLGLVFPRTTNSEVTPESCRRFTQQSMAALVEDAPDVVVIGLATDEWVWLNGVEVVDPETGGVVTDVAGKSRLVEDSLAEMVTRLRNAGSEVVLLDVVPKPYSFDPRGCSNLAILVDARRCLPAEFALAGRELPAAANRLQARAATRGGGETWGFASEICPDGTCAPVLDDRLVWRDPSHISGAMSELLVPAAARQLRATLAARANP